jgi:hypothetical protein
MRRPSRRRFGYLVWGIAGLLIAIPEISAAFDKDAMHFSTISEMSGHIERIWPTAELLVVLAIVFALFSLIRLRPAAGVRRTHGGRLTRPAVVKASPTYVRWLFVMCAAAAVAFVIGATALTVALWDDRRHFHGAYVLYGLLALFWIVGPSIAAFVLGNDAPFPTLFRTVRNLEDGLRPRWPWLAWLVSYVIVAGLAILLIHITLYPFPDITHILNPNG